MTRAIKTEGAMLNVKRISWVDDVLILTFDSDHGEVVYELRDIDADNIKSEIDMTYSTEERTTSATGSIHFEAGTVKRVKG